MHKSYIKQIAITIMVICILILHSWTSYISYHFPYIGIELIQSSSNKWVISEFYSGSTGERIGLKILDEVTLIDKKAVDQHVTVRKWGTIEQARSIEVIRDGSFLSFETDSLGNGLSARYFLCFSAEILFLGLASLLYFKAKPASSVAYLITAFTLIGLAFMCAEASARDDTMARFVVNTAMSIIPFLFAHFIIVFLKERGYSPISSRWIHYVYIILTVTGIIRTSYFLPISFVPLFKTFHIINLGCFAAGCIFNLWLLSYVYIKKRNENSYPSTIIKTMWISFFLSFAPFLLLSVIPDILWGKSLLNYSYSIFFILLFPVTFIYFVFTNKLFNIDMIVNRMLFLFCLTLVPSLIITSSMMILLVASHPTPIQIIIIFGTTFLVVYGIIYLLDKSHQQLTGLLFPGRHRLVISFNRIINNLRYMKSFEDIRRIMLPDLCDALAIDAVAIRLCFHDEIRMINFGEINSLEVELAINSSRSVSLDYIIHRINDEKDFSSYLILTYKSSGTLFSKEELQWISHLVGYLSIVIENVYLIEKLSLRVTDLLDDLNSSQETIRDVTWLRRSVFQLQEGERKRIASDLHDTVMQDLYFAKQRVASLLNKQTQKMNINNELQELAEYIEIINQNLRETTYKVYPHLLQDLGFSAAIENLFDTQRLDCIFDLHLQIDQPSDYDQLDLDLQLHLFRISQEMLSNAKKHSNANHVLFHFVVNESDFILEYNDDGTGFDVHNINSSGIGLTQIKNRIASVLGETHIISSKENGSSIHITIPKSIRGVSYEKVN